MKKSILSKLLCLTISAATVFSLGGQLLADEVGKAGDPEDVFAQDHDGKDSRDGDRFSWGEEDSAEEVADTEEVIDDELEVIDDADEISDVDLSKTLTYEGCIDLSTLDFDYGEYELAEGYINREMNPNREALDKSYNYRGQLSKPSLTAYDYLRARCTEVANGSRSYTLFTIPVSTLKIELTASDIGVSSLKNASERTLQNGSYNGLIKNGYNPDTIIDFLLFSCPYELYWMDKTGNLMYNWDLELNDTKNPTKLIVSGFSFTFPVAKEYQKNGNYLSMDTSYGKAVQASVDNAKNIIKSCSNMDDYNKLWTYANKICELTDYNFQAVENERTPYGNPWQMIWIFDGDPKTKVVCEGYSKGFQFLCDNTTFKSSAIYAICAYGDCGGPHMWNVVHMDDGKNYLVDTTNMDGGLNLFLRGGKSYSDGRAFLINANGYSLYYVYDNYYKNYFSSSVTNLAATDYVYNGSTPPTPTPVKTGWVKNDKGEWLYYDSTGTKVTGWQKIGGAWYFFGGSGIMQTGWQKISGTWYYFRPSGSMVSSSWLKWGNSWYYLKSSGAMATGWLKIGKTWYYFNASGVMQTGWQKVGGSWYYLGSTGAMQTGWIKSGGKWYYLNASGAMVTGWQTIGGYKYYFNPTTGAMVTGTVTIGGKTYKFDNNGHLIS